MAAYYTLHIAGLTRELKICSISDKLDIARKSPSSHGIPIHTIFRFICTADSQSLKNNGSFSR